MSSKVKKIIALPLALLLVLGLISPSFLTSQKASAAPATPLEWKFNMAHPGASTEGMEGWTHIYPTSPAYSSDIGYGILDTTGLNSRDRNQAGQTPLVNQFILNAAAFRLDVPDGKYQVTVYSGDITGSGTVNLNIAVDGESKGRVSSKAAVNSLSFEYQATKGYIQLDFSTHLYLNGIVVTEIVPEVPESPTTLQASATSKVISLNWEASTTENVTYTVYRSLSGDEDYEALAAGLSELTYQDTTAIFGSSYDYYVVAVKDAIESEPSNIITTELQAITVVPDAPASLSVRNVSSSGIALQWNASELADSYNLYRSDSATGEFDVVASELTGLTYNDTSANTSIVNYYKVTAVNEIGESEASPVAESIIYIPPAPLPGSFPYRFDIGLGEAAANSIKVDSNAIYSEDIGYGFMDEASVTWGSNNDTDLLRNDFAIPSADAVFSIDLPNGDYRVTIIAGDSATATQTGVIAERIQKVQIPEAAATGYMERTFDIALVDGQLNLSFNGSTPIINAITIDKLPARQAGSQPTVYMAGDSTVQTYDEYWKPEAGWGQMLNRYFTDQVSFDNHAIGGRSSKTFITEGRLDTVLRMIRPGDLFLIQFGHNDATISVPERYASVPDYKEYLKTYVLGARQRGAEPILVTPVGRRSFNTDTGKFNVSFPEYVQGMKEVAEELDVKVVDLSALSIAFYDEIGFEATRSVFLHTDPGVYSAWPNGSTDDTHFQEYGAIQLARLIAGAISELDLSISEYVISTQAPENVPDAPANVIVSSISNAGATVIWDAVDGADIYKVYRKLASEEEYTLVTTSTSPLASILGMTDGTNYNVYVTAVNAKGDSEPSQVVSFRTKSADYKYDFQGHPDYSNGGIDAEGYTIINLGNSEATSTSYTEERGYGLIYDPGMIVRNRAPSDAHKEQLPENVLDAVRDWIGYFNTGWQFRVDVPNGIYAIKLYVGDFSGSARTNLAVNGVNYGAVNAANSSYTERVINNIQVKDGHLLFHFTGSTAIANALEITTILVAPSNLHLEDSSLDANEPYVSLAWNEIEDISKYNVYRQIQGSSQRELVAQTSEPAWTDENVIVGASYLYSVSAVDPGGIESVRSNELTVHLYDESNGAIDAPQNLTVTDIHKNDVTIAWDAVEGSTAYAIYRSESLDGDYELVGFSSEASFTDTTVLTTIPYYFKVRTLHDGLPSELSDAIQSEAVTTLLRQMEALDRGIVAIDTEDGVFVSWRLLGTDPSSISFHLYRDGERITSEPITESTNLLDEAGTVEAVYAVAAVIDGIEQPAYDTTTVWSEQYIDIPLNKPEDGVTPLGDPYTYSANDSSVADLDGDGEYEIIVKWSPSNSKDNSHSGYTGNVYLDAYEFTGEQLWRIDLGRNIRAGAHYTQYMVYDLDGDGKAEVALKTSDGTIDGQNNVIGDRTKDYRNSTGYVIIGNEYLTVFDGQTGAAIDTVDYDPPRGVVADWGDGYGNRVDRFAAAIAYLDGEQPSLVMARGVYTRIALAAYTFKDGKLTQQWKFDTLDEGNGAYEGQGYHSLSVADVDFDGKDEIVYGQMIVDDNGKGLYSTGLGHGDALHVSDFVPDREGLEIFAVQEHTDAPYGYDLRDARTGEILWGVNTGIDTGRGLIADVDPRYPGAEAWAIDGEWNSRTGGIHNATTGEKIGDNIPTSNFAIWWDGDVLRELLDHDYDDSIGAGTGVIDKWDYENGELTRILTADGTLSNNSTKGTPALQADLLGDWREEVLWRTEDSSALRLYTTTDVTEERIFTLMHDPQYRLAIAWQNVAYNQPPHPSFYIGEGMTTPPQPNIYVNEVAVTSIAIQSASSELSVGGTLQLKALIAPAAATNKAVNWSVTSPSGRNTSLATIDQNGLLKASRSGQVKVIATAADGSNVTAELTITIKSNGNGSNDNPPASTPQPTTPPTTGQPVVVESKKNENGVAEAVITVELLQQLAAGNSSVEISLPSDSEDQLVLTLSPEALEQWNKSNVSNIEITTPLGTIKLNGAIGQTSGDSGNLEISLASKPAPAAIAAETGSSTVLDVKVSRNGEDVDNIRGNVTVTLPQAVEQQEDKGLWVVYSINEDGSLTPVKNSRLSSDDKLTFKASHSGQYVVGYANVPLGDVATKAPWAKDAVNTLAARGIVTGYSDGNFQPERKITRAEFIKLLLESADLIQSDAESTFTDVDSENWFYNAAASAQQLGLVSGKADGQFAGNDEITREEMAIIAYRLINKLNLQPARQENAPFVDAEQIAPYAKDAVRTMQQSGILQGNGANRFNPKQNASRGEAAVIIYRLWQLFE